MSESPVPAPGTSPTSAAARITAAGVLDVLAVLLLIAVALLGLQTMFGGWGYLIVGVVSAVLGVAIALVTLRLPVVVLIAAVPISGLLLGGPVALRTGGLGAGIPDLQVLADVMQGSATGWGELLTTLPVVDLAGPPALVPFVLAFVGGATASAAALRTRSSGGPVLPLLAVLVVVLLLRHPDSGPVDWFPVAFAVVAVAWVALRGLEFAPDAGRVRGASRGWAGRGLAAAGVVAVALLVAIPVTSGSSTTTGATLRGRIGQLPDVAGLDSPLRRFRTFTDQGPGVTENVHDKVLLTVDGAPKGGRLRMLTLDRYDGTEWQPGNGTMPGTIEDRFLRVDTRVQNPTRGREYRVEVAVTKAYRSAWIPTVGSLTSFRFLNADRFARRGEVRYDLATSTAVIPVGLKASNSYEFTAIVPDQRLTRTMQAWPGDLITVKGAQKADPLLDRVLASPAEPMRKVFVLAKFLRDTGQYSNGATPGEQQYAAGHDSARLFKGFLLARRAVGNDEQYAAAMAVLANRVGVPARVVVGAVVPGDGKVRGSDVHAWVEVRVADGSWRTLPTEQFMSRRPPRRQLPPVPPPRMPKSSVTQEQDQPTEQKTKEAEKAEDRADAATRSVVVRLLPWLVPLLLVLLVPVAKLVRRRLRRTRGRRSDRMAGAWTELVDHALDLGIPVLRHTSRPAQARELARAGAGALSREGDEGVFASAEPEEEIVRAYWEQVLREQAQLSGGRPLRRRLWAPFNPGSLIRRRPRFD